jgi:hypothetical protein
MLDLQSISDAEDNGAIILRSGDSFLVVDSVRPWNAVHTSNDLPAALSKLRQLAGNTEDLPRIRTHLSYVGPWPAADPAIYTLRRLIRQHGVDRTTVRTYVSAESDLIGGLDKLLGPQSQYPIQFWGSVPDLSEHDVAVLLKRRATVVEVAGWPQDSHPDVVRLSRLSDLGLRIPVCVYVHRFNLADALGMGDRLLQATRYSGLSFEPVSAHPGLTLDDLQILPTSEEYSALLAEAYQRFQHYDDVFEPLISLVDNLRFGGWDPLTNQGLPHKYLVDASGKVRSFRQFPWAIPIDPTGESDATDKMSVRLASACGSCRWRCICGGCEATANEALFELACGYRKLFLEFFTIEMHRGLPGRRGAGKC